MKSTVTIAKFAVAAIAVATLMVSCSGGDDEIIPPTVNPLVSSVTLNPSSVTLPATSTGRVILDRAAASGATVTLRSTDTSQATVPASVTIGSGGTTADFAVTAIAAGSPRIEASLNGSTQGATLTISAAPPTGTVSLTSLSLASSSIVGGNSVQGTVTLSGAAPAGGATVTLSSSDQGVATVPGSVTVAAGSTSGTFSITTRAVGGTFQITITGSFGGATQTAALAVTPQPPTGPTASFVVTSSGGAANSCPMGVGGNRLECTFNGSASTGNNLTQFQWTYELAGQSRLQIVTNGGSSLTNPLTDCGFFSGVTTKTSGGPIQLVVTLVVVDGSGTASAPVRNPNAFVTPLNNTCGFIF